MLQFMHSDIANTIIKRVKEATAKSDPFHQSSTASRNPDYQGSRHTYAPVELHFKTIVYVIATYYTACNCT